MKPMVVTGRELPLIKPGSNRPLCEVYGRQRRSRGANFSLIPCASFRLHQQPASLPLEGLGRDSFVAPLTNEPNARCDCNSDNNRPDETA